MIPVYIASSKRFECVEGLTQKSILANTYTNCDIKYVYPEDIGMKETGCTGFTNVRYAIPELLRKNGQEYGIYLDCDMIVLGDISELWELRQPHKWVCLADGSTEVSVIHRAIDLPYIEMLHLYRKYQLSIPSVPTIPMSWNVEDTVQEGMKLLHFTALDTQPWFHEHPCHEAVEIYERYHHAA